MSADGGPSRRPPERERSPSNAVATAAADLDTGAVATCVDTDASSGLPQVGELSPTALARVAAAVAHEHAVPRSIGRYRLVGMIGEGGMGEVWRAEQEQPIRRTAALKLIKLGMDTRQVIARFEAERQALALMNHPNVAKVLDAGATDAGRPYFVMEYVPGEPITVFCDRHQYTIGQRLRLFAQACAAVQHAHQKGILHRDLKPGNILVTTEPGEAQVKVIDFGVAKALQTTAAAMAGDGPTAAHTLAGQLIGTPEYMSPEQALSDGQDVDTRSDVYSLGVVLYELLTGALPYDSRKLRGSGVAGMQRIIRDVDPPRPSTRLGGLDGADAARVAGQRQVRVGELQRELKRELEWIPLMAMRKAPAARYATAFDFAQDIGDYLAQRPLRAGPESRRYRVKKFVRRNKIPLAVAAGFAALLAGGTATYVRGVRAEQVKTVAALVEAERRSRETDQVAEFQGRMIGVIDVRLMGRRLRDDLLVEAERSWRQAGLGADEVERRRAQLDSLLADANLTNTAIRSLDRNVFRRALDAIEQEFGGQPLVKARLLQHVATTMVRLGLPGGATAPQTSALSIRRDKLGNDHPDTLASVHAMAWLLWTKADFRRAEGYALEELEARRRRGDATQVLGCTLFLGDVLARQGRLEEAERYKRENLQGCTLAFGPDDQRTAFARLQVGQILMWRGKLPEAEPYIVESLGQLRRVLREDHLNTLGATSTLGTLRLWQGDLAQAESLFRECLGHYRAVQGDDNRETLFVRLRLAQVLRRRGKLDEAQPQIEAALAGCRATLSEDHADTLWAREELAWLRLAQGHSEEAEAGFAELHRRAAQPDIDARTAARLRSGYGVCLVSRSRHAEAERLLVDAHDALTQVGLEWDERTRVVVVALAETCDYTGRGDEAARWRARLTQLRAATRPNSS